MKKFVCIVATMLALVVAAPASATTWGFASGNAFNYPSAVSAGASVVRGDASFAQVEPQMGTWDWTGPDWQAALAQQNGGKWFPVLGYNAPWNSDDGNVFTPPSTGLQRLYYAQFVQSFASRYQGRVAAYEIWNEPNNPTFWHNPNAGNYALLFDAAYDAIRGVDATTPIIMGGVNDSSGWNSYIGSFFSASARDGYSVNVHPYNSPTNVLNTVLSSWPGRRVSVTEYGAAGSLPEAQRASLMSNARSTILHDDAVRAATRGDGRNVWDIGYSWDDPNWAMSSGNVINSAGRAWLGQ